MRVALFLKETPPFILISTRLQGIQGICPSTYWNICECRWFYAYPERNGQHLGRFNFGFHVPNVLRDYAVEKHAPIVVTSKLFGPVLVTKDCSGFMAVRGGLLTGMVPCLASSAHLEAAYCLIYLLYSILRHGGILNLVSDSRWDENPSMYAERRIPDPH